MFKDIECSNGKYSIDEYGNVKRNDTGKILRYFINNKGYKCVDLMIDGTKKRFLVHRLVAMTFVPNIHNERLVNHKDNNPLNCYVENLEWCSYSYNNKYGYICGNRTYTDKQREARKRPKVYLHKKVRQYTKDGIFVKEYKSVTEASKQLGCSISSVANCAKGINKTCCGFIMKYVV